jgi:hypothetical protein
MPDLDLDPFESRAHAGETTPGDAYALLREICVLRDERVHLRTAVDNWHGLAQRQHTELRQLREVEAQAAVVYHDAYEALDAGRTVDPTFVMAALTCPSPVVTARLLADDEVDDA